MSSNETSIGGRDVDAMEVTSHVAQKPNGVRLFDEIRPSLFLVIVGCRCSFPTSDFRLLAISLRCAPLRAALLISNRLIHRVNSTARRATFRIRFFKLSVMLARRR
jgi:hypothetical protein